MAAGLTDDTDVETLAVVETGTVTIAGRPIVVRGVETIKGTPPLVMLEGRTPEVGEIVLGRRTMSDLGVEIGDVVDAVGTDSSRPLRIVGEAVFAGILDIPEASWGAAVDRTVLNALGYGDNGAGSGAVVGLASGVDGDEFASRVERESGGSPTPREEPIELARLREIEALPWILAAFLAGAGLLSLLNAIVTTARRRGHDLAVLRSVGFAPNGVRRAILVQSVALAVFGLAIGVPAGLIAGRLLWSRLASSLGVQVLVEVPWPTVAATCAAALTAAAAFSLVPARRAARRPIAEVLRAE
jgi:predicted lysophospholipase L1 biosynthesis ABC-type transport system permease subunit